MKNLFCYHIYPVGRYEKLIYEVINYCNDCLLCCDKVIICINSTNVDIINNIKRLFDKYNNCEFIIHKNNNFEFDTLNFLHDFSIKNSDWNVGYIHTKGVSTIENICIDDWRKYMLYFVGTQYKDCITMLNEYDVVGVDLVDKPVVHFSGNFWWATSNYIKILPKPENIPIKLTFRHNAEFWICVNNGKYYSFHNSNIDVYNRHNVRYCEKLYKKDSYI